MTTFVKIWRYGLSGNYKIEEANGSFYKSTNKKTDFTVLFPEDEYNIIKYPGKVYKFTPQNSNKPVYVAHDDLQYIEGLEGINFQNLMAKHAEEAKKEGELAAAARDDQARARALGFAADGSSLLLDAARAPAAAKPRWKWREGGGRKTRRTCRTKGKTRRSKA